MLSNQQKTTTITATAAAAVTAVTTAVKYVNHKPKQIVSYLQNQNYTQTLVDPTLVLCLSIFTLFCWLARSLAHQHRNRIRFDKELKTISK